MTEPVRIIPEDEFDARIKAMGVRTIRSKKVIRALKLVMVHGRRNSEAAEVAGVDPAVVTRGLAKMAKPICPHCGQLMPS